MYYSAPTYNIDTSEWEETSFETKRDVIKYIDSHYKYPSEYNIKYATGYWNRQAKIWQSTGSYPVYLNKSIEFKKHWDFEKRKSDKNGFVIYKKPSEGVEFPVPGLYYFYLNYCPIEHKDKGVMEFPTIYDGDYHYFMYILRCILYRKYAAVLKKRQSGYTLKNMAIKTNIIWFGTAQIAKTFASDESKVKDSWGIMQVYRDHINKHCGWKRGFDPSGVLNWQVRRKNKDGSYTGNLSKALGFTTKQDPTNGVGGSAAFIYGEESGINPTLDVTHEFITSNASLGGLVTGLIIYSGAVGELEKCEPLKHFLLNPEQDGFLPCDNNIEEDLEFGSKVGFFVPEWWNYVSVEEDEDGIPIGDAMYCFDENGNTNKELALKEIVKWRKLAERKSPEKYRFYCSQRPLSIKEAFAVRKTSKFPLNLIEAQKRRIEDKMFSIQYVDIDYDDKGKVTYKRSNKLPIKDFPISPKMENKEGVIVMIEPPIANPPWMTYIASIDPVKIGKSTNSQSLCSIYIYKLDTLVSREKEDLSSEHLLEHGKIVCYWCGRFDDIGDTHKRLQMMIEWYYAFTLVENNASQFINYMIGVNKQYMLVPTEQFVFDKELNSVSNGNKKDFGWGNYGRTFVDVILPFAIDYLKEKIKIETQEKTGEVMKVTYGVERIPDVMLLKEMEAYQEGLNVDRLVSFASLVAFISIILANRGANKRKEVSEKTKEDNSHLYKIVKQAFNTKRNFGNKNGGSGNPRSPFRNLR